MISQRNRVVRSQIFHNKYTAGLFFSLRNLFGTGYKKIASRMFPTLVVRKFLSFPQIAAYNLMSWVKSVR